MTVIPIEHVRYGRADFDLGSGIGNGVLGHRLSVSAL